LTVAPFLKSYTQYCNNYPNAMGLYNKKKTTHQKFGKFIESMRPQTGNLELSSYFLLPVQRIPRYKMLLQDVVKHTWDTHPDFEKLTKGIPIFPNFFFFFFSFILWSCH
jgi:FYVE/RhoGEF/PH domain-containing protein 3